MALPPLELFSLERRGRLLPGGLFVGWKQSALSIQLQQLEHEALSTPNRESFLNADCRQLTASSNLPTPWHISSSHRRCDTGAARSLRVHRESHREKHSSM